MEFSSVHDCFDLQHTWRAVPRSHPPFVIRVPHTLWTSPPEGEGWLRHPSPPPNQAFFSSATPGLRFHQTDSPHPTAKSQCTALPPRCFRAQDMMSPAPTGGLSSGTCAHNCLCPTAHPTCLSGTLSPGLRRAAWCCQLYLVAVWTGGLPSQSTPALAVSLRKRPCGRWVCQRPHVPSLPRSWSVCVEDRGSGLEEGSTCGSDLVFLLSQEQAGLLVGGRGSCTTPQGPWLP